VPELRPEPGELRIHKQFNSSFEQTPLEQELAKLGVSHLALAGAMTNACIRSTAYAALERGYDLTLIRDAHTTRTLKLEDGAVLDAENMVRDLNLAMDRVRYPGRANGTGLAGSFDFAGLA
jgi:nicotinamidase-related amidase